VPPYNVGEIQEGYDKLYQIHIPGKDRAKIKKLMSQHDKIVTFIDGSCLGNPGPAGASAAFFAS
jgi:hypothetical protein